MDNLEIKTAVLHVLASELDRSIINVFAIKKFNELHAVDEIVPGVKANYNGFEIISEELIRIKYTYGETYKIFDNFFDVNL